MQGTKKDLAQFSSKKYVIYGIETNSRLTAKLAETENEDPSVVGGGVTVLDHSKGIKQS